MGATGNMSLVKQMAAHMATEARAVNNYMKGNADSNKGGGLNYWGPTMNIGQQTTTALATNHVRYPTCTHIHAYHRCACVPSAPRPANFSLC